GSNLPAFGWTNQQYLVSSTGTSATLEFDFNNTPGAFGLDDITVQTIPAPVLSSATVSAGNIRFSWNALLNVSYQIQSTTNFNMPWANLGSPILATNTVMTLSLPTGGATKGFYRVVMLP